MCIWRRWGPAAKLIAAIGPSGRRDDFAEPLKLPQTGLQLATTARAPTAV